MVGVIDWLFRSLLRMCNFTLLFINQYIRTNYIVPYFFIASSRPLIHPSHFFFTHSRALTPPYFFFLLLVNHFKKSVTDFLTFHFGLAKNSRTLCYSRHRIISHINLGNYFARAANTKVINFFFLRSTLIEHPVASAAIFVIKRARNGR